MAAPSAEGIADPRPVQADDSHGILPGDNELICIHRSSFHPLPVHVRSLRSELRAGVSIGH